MRSKISGLKVNLTEEGLQICANVSGEIDGNELGPWPFCYTIPYGDIQREAKNAAEGAESAWRRFLRWIRKRL